MTPAEIRAFRAAHNLTREQLAEALGVTTQAVMHWETPEASRWHRRPPAYLYRALEHLAAELALAE